MRKRSVAILVFDGAEVLDFAGPFEVFAVTSELNNDALFDVRLVAAEKRVITAVNGMHVLPNADFDELRTPDILIVAGGSGTRPAMHDRKLLEWVAHAAERAEIVISVCSGARILAVLGLLDKRDATTHHQVFDHVAELAPSAVLHRNMRFVDTGKIVTTGGISAGIDGSFHIMQRLLGADIASMTAAYMEYDWRPNAVRYLQREYASV